MDYKHTCDTNYTHFQGITNNVYALLVMRPSVRPSLCLSVRPSLCLSVCLQQDPAMVEQLSKNITRQGLTNYTLNFLRVSSN